MPTATEAARLASALGHSDDPYSITVTPKGGEPTPIRIEPLTLDQISNIMLLLDKLADKGIRVDELVDRKSFSNVQMITRGGEDFRAILATAAEQEPEFIGRLNFVDVARVAGKVWTTNKGFFDENQIEILAAFGLEEKDLEGIRNLFRSMKLLLNYSPPASQTSADSPSIKPNESSTDSNETSETKSSE